MCCWARFISRSWPFRSTTTMPAPSESSTFCSSCSWAAACRSSTSFSFKVALAEPACASMSFSAPEISSPTCSAITGQMSACRITSAVICEACIRPGTDSSRKVAVVAITVPLTLCRPANQITGMNASSEIAGVTAPISCRRIAIAAMSSTGTSASQPGANRFHGRTKARAVATTRIAIAHR